MADPRPATNTPSTSMRGRGPDDADVILHGVDQGMLIKLMIVITMMITSHDTGCKHADAKACPKDARRGGRSDRHRDRQARVGNRPHRSSVRVTRPGSHVSPDCRARRTHTIAQPYLLSWAVFDLLEILISEDWPPLCRWSRKHQAQQTQRG